MMLTITACDNEGFIHTTMTLRLVMKYTREAGVLYEEWTSPDFPLPQPMISEILTFLEQHVCAPVSQDRAITKAEIPASLISRLMGPAWMSQFRQIAAGTQAPTKLVTKEPTFLEGLKIIDKAVEPAEPVSHPEPSRAMEIEVAEGVWINSADLPPSLRPKNKPTR
jgi:hypothetical protein